MAGLPTAAEDQITTRHEIIRVSGLRPGDLVRVISPSLPSLAFARRSAADGVAELERLGLRCDFSANATDISDDGRSAGSAEVRASDLHDAFVDPEVAGVLCAVGGLTSAELLPLLDADLIRAHPKPLIGRSDNTYLNAFLLERAGITSFTGAAFVTQFADPNTDPRTVESFVRVVLGGEPVRLKTSSPRTENSVPSSWDGEVHSWDEPERAGLDAWLRQGSVTGRLVGGEIGIVADLLAADLLTVHDRVLWLDVVAEGLDYFEEQLARLEPLVAGAGLRALLIADNPSVPFDVWVDVVEKSLPRLAGEIAGPVLVGGDLGHYQPAWLLPYGDVVEIDSASGITVNGLPS
ncbi:LD-carboxypeptidase [Lentzea sp. NPDC058436]|uniref:LD-carboxypeptidase n=1 Tax=Lentzea sp. NPDC058436 TaxID=3346499 RepID=UPI00365DD82F